MSAARLAMLNNRVIRTPARPSLRARVLVISTDRARGGHVRAVLLRGHFSARLADPRAAIAALRAGEVPQVIVIDMADPTFDGLALCGTLRKLRVSSAIMMLHPEGDLDDLLDGYEAGTDAYMTGRLDHAELFRRLEALSWPHSICA